jgi:hypothetical protein
MSNTPIGPLNTSRRGMAQDSLTSGNLTRALNPEPPKSNLPPTTGSAADGGGAGKSTDSGNSK